MNDPRKQPIFPRSNGGTATAKPPAAKPAPAPTVKKEPRADVLLRQWAERGTNVVVHFTDGAELTGRVLQVEVLSISFLDERGPVHIGKGAVAWVRAIENPG